MSMTLSQRGANANSPARLPGLQALRSSDPQTQKALEALREWVEVRLGSRGDKYERAITLRDFEQLLVDVFAKLDELGDFNGDTTTLRCFPVRLLPSTVRVGALVVLESGDVYVGVTGAWKKLAFVP